jgi:ferredoxin--NADP+ reductase
LTDCDPTLDPEDLRLNPESDRELADKTNFVAAKNLELFQSFASRPTGTKRQRCVFQFLLSPVEFVGRGKLERAVLARNRLEGAPFRQVARETGELIELPCGVLFRSIGYRGIPIPGVPFDERQGRFPHRDGRLLDQEGRPLPGLYATGGIKRGPTGIIGTNRADSVATVASLLADVPAWDAAEKPGLEALAAGRAACVVSYQDWRKIDAAEVQRGQIKGKPREKFTRVEEMLACV